ncbi:XK-related protein 6-like [Glandiceps talaboti]
MTEGGGEPGDRVLQQQGSEKKDKSNISYNGIKRQKYTIWDFLFTFGSMITFLADLATDLLLSVQYYRHDDYWWCGLTFGFIFVPSIITQAFSIRWYHVDLKEDQGDGDTVGKKTSTCKEWFFWGFLHIFQLGPLNRYIMTLWYGWRSRSDPQHYYKMVFEYRDVTMLRLLESFMESAPQLVLQLYIMTRQQEAHWLTATSACVSLVSLAWALAAYHKALRESRDDKENISYVGIVFQMTWRLFTVAARVIALALFASIFLWAVFIIVIVHWLGMTLWLVVQKTEFCGTGVEEILFDGVIGIVYIFCFFNMKEGRTRYRMATFYCIIFVENSFLIGLWYWQKEEDYVYTIPALFFVWGGFVIGIFCMILYYLCCHPTGNIQCCPDDSQGDAESRYVQTTTAIDGLIDVVDATPSQRHEPQVLRSPCEANFFIREKKSMSWGGGWKALHSPGEVPPAVNSTTPNHFYVEVPNTDGMAEECEGRVSKESNQSDIKESETEF